MDLTLKNTLLAFTFLPSFYFMMTCIFSDLFDSQQFRPYDPSQEPIFPPELRLHSEVFSSQSLVFKTDRMLWLRPTSLEDLLHLKKKFPDAKIVVGNTELGVEIKFKKCYYPVMIQPTKVKIYSNP